MALNVLVLGAGAMGGNHVRVYSELKETNRIAVVDSDREALDKIKAKKFEKVAAYQSAAEALKAERIDAASVAVPTNLHYKAAGELLAKGIDLLVEKPITESIEDGKKLVVQAAREGLVLMVGHIERFNPAVQALKKNLNLIGEPFYASAHRFGIPTQRDVGEAFLDQAVHDVDVISYLVGKYPKKVSATEAKIVDAKSNDLCAAIYEFDSFKATVEANRVVPIKSRELVVLGRKGAARLEYISQDLSIIRAEHVETKYHTFDEIVLRVGRGTEIKPYFAKEEPLKLELQHFLDCVAHERKPLVTGEDGVRALAAALAGMKAAKTGRKEEIQA